MHIFSGPGNFFPLQEFENMAPRKTKHMPGVPFQGQQKFLIYIIFIPPPRFPSLKIGALIPDDPEFYKITVIE